MKPTTFLSTALPVPRVYFIPNIKLVSHSIFLPSADCSPHLHLYHKALNVFFTGTLNSLSSFLSCTPDIFYSPSQGLSPISQALPSLLWLISYFCSHSSIHSLPPSPWPWLANPTFSELSPFNSLTYSMQSWPLFGNSIFCHNTV